MRKCNLTRLAICVHRRLNICMTRSKLWDNLPQGRRRLQERHHDRVGWQYFRSTGQGRWHQKGAPAAAFSGLYSIQRPWRSQGRAASPSREIHGGHTAGNSNSQDQRQAGICSSPSIELHHSGSMWRTPSRLQWSTTVRTSMQRRRQNFQTGNSHQGGTCRIALLPSSCSLSSKPLLTYAFRWIR